MMVDVTRTLWSDLERSNCLTSLALRHYRFPYDTTSEFSIPTIKKLELYGSISPFLLTPSLEILNLQHTEVNFQQVAKLILSAPKLRSIVVYDIDISQNSELDGPIAIHNDAHFPQIEELAISCCEESQVCLDLLQGCTRPRSLSLHLCDLAVDMDPKFVNYEHEDPGTFGKARGVIAWINQAKNLERLKIASLCINLAELVLQSLLIGPNETSNVIAPHLNRLELVGYGFRLPSLFRKVSYERQHFLETQKLGHSFKITISLTIGTDFKNKNIVKELELDGINWRDFPSSLDFITQIDEREFDIDSFARKGANDRLQFLYQHLTS